MSRYRKFCTTVEAVNLADKWIRDACCENEDTEAESEEGEVVQKIATEWSIRDRQKIGELGTGKLADIQEMSDELYKMMDIFMRRIETIKKRRHVTPQEYYEIALKTVDFYLRELINTQEMQEVEHYQEWIGGLEPEIRRLMKEDLGIEIGASELKVPDEVLGLIDQMYFGASIGEREFEVEIY